MTPLSRLSAALCAQYLSFYVGHGPAFGVCVMAVGLAEATPADRQLDLPGAGRHAGCVQIDCRAAEPIAMGAYWRCPVPIGAVWLLGLFAIASTSCLRSFMFGCDGHFQTG